MRTLLLSFSVLGMACAGGGGDLRPADIAAPQITLRQPGSIFFGNEGVTAVSIDVEVANRAAVPVTVREISVTSFAMTDYHLRPTTRTVNVVVPAGESRTVGVVATAESRVPRSHSQEPLSVRAVVRMEANGRSFREVVMQRMAGTGASRE